MFVLSLASQFLYDRYATFTADLIKTILGESSLLDVYWP